MITLTKNEFIQALKENSLPTKTYCVEEEICIEEIRVQNINLGKGLFKKTISFNHLSINGNFDLGRSTFREGLNISRIAGNLNLSSATLQGKNLIEDLHGSLDFKKSKIEGVIKIIGEPLSLDFAEAQFDDESSKIEVTSEKIARAFHFWYTSDRKLKIRTMYL